MESMGLISRSQSIHSRIKEALSKFHESGVELGQLLLTMREDRLFVELGHDTFEDYCQKEHGFTQPRGQQLITFALEVANADNHGYPAPANERQTRALVAAPPEKRGEVMERATKKAEAAGKPLTSTLVEDAVVEVVHGKPLAVDVHAPWAPFQTEIESIISDLRAVGRRLNDTLKVDTDNSQVLCQWAYFLSHQGTVGAVNALIRNLQQNLPGEASECPPGYIPVRSVRTRKAATA
jgi:hypothetical protein